MIVREARKSDFNKLVNIGNEFAQVSQKAHGFSISIKKIEDFTSSIIDSPEHIALVLEDGTNIRGIFLAIITKPFFSEDISAQEMVWYVQSDCKEGLKLYFEFERQCKLRGINKMILGYKHNFINMRKIYKRMGFRILESQYIKDLR